MRKLAYEIEQRTEADYRFFRFETEGGLLDDLNHNLRIADGVLRFRIFKVDPRSPAIVPPAPVATPPRPRLGADAARQREPAAAEAAESTQARRGDLRLPSPRQRKRRPPRPRRKPSRRRRGHRRRSPAADAAEEPAEDTAGEEPAQAAEPDSEPEASRKAARCGLPRRRGGEKRRSRP